MRYICNALLPSTAKVFTEMWPSMAEMIQYNTYKTTVKYTLNMDRPTEFDEQQSTFSRVDTMNTQKKFCTNS